MQRKEREVHWLEKTTTKDAVHSFVHFFDYVKGYIANVWFARFYH